MVLVVCDSAWARSASQAGVTIRVERPERSTTTALSPIGRTPESTNTACDSRNELCPKLTATRPSSTASVRWRAVFSNLDAWMPIARDLYRRGLKWQCRRLWVRVDVRTTIEWKHDDEIKTEKIDAQGR